MNNNYKVCVHAFPDGKRYIGCTHGNAKNRWQGGLGYEEQPVFSAILKYGWNNVRHYILMDGLTKDEALLYEAAFIYSWKTYTRSKGYNTILPNIAEAKEINVPSFQSCKKVRVDDIYQDDVVVRRDRRYTNSFGRQKRVRCIESGEIFENAEQASMFCSTGRKQTVYSAIKSGGASGTCMIYDDECGDIEVPAHWEYVD